MLEQVSALDPGIDLALRLMSALRNPSFLPVIYPALYEGGVADGSLHAYMLSALVLVGDRLGYTPVCDAPTFDRLDILLTGDGAKRPDALWFRRGTDEVKCLVEFERYSSRSLPPKALNLLVMGKEHRQTLDLAVLHYWSYARCSEMDLIGVASVFAHGFQHVSGLSFQPLDCPALVVETIVLDQAGTVTIAGSWPQLFISKGENKAYVVEMLNEAV